MSTSADGELSLLLMKDGHAPGHGVRGRGEEDAGGLQAGPDVPEVGALLLVHGGVREQNGFWEFGMELIARIANAVGDRQGTGAGASHSRKD